MSKLPVRYNAVYVFNTPHLDNRTIEYSQYEYIDNIFSAQSLMDKTAECTLGGVCFYGSALNVFYIKNSNKNLYFNTLNPRNVWSGEINLNIKLNVEKTTSNSVVDIERNSIFVFYNDTSKGVSYLEIKNNKVIDHRTIPGTMAVNTPCAIQINGRAEVVWNDSKNDIYAANVNDNFSVHRLTQQNGNAIKTKERMSLMKSYDGQIYLIHAHSEEKNKYLCIKFNDKYTLSESVTTIALPLRSAPTAYKFNSDIILVLANTNEDYTNLHCFIYDGNMGLKKEFIIGDASSQNICMLETAWLIS